MNFYYYFIIYVYVLFFVIKLVLDYLNITYFSDKLPTEAKGIYDEEKYKQFQQYEKTKFKFKLVNNLFNFLLILLLLIFGGFGYLDQLIRNYVNGEITVSLIFFLIILVANTVLSMPFERYYNFKIEGRFGFNKMTKKTFLLDTVKGLFLSIIIGGILLYIITFAYTKMGTSFWYVAWIVVSLFVIFFGMFYSSLIVPLFNKQAPLPDGELKEKIINFAEKVGFTIDNIYVIDGSKRTTKANAYFSGLGPKKRIVLYDNLIDSMGTDEIVAVLAHEIGHYKKKHILKMITISIIQNGIYFYLLSLLLNNQQIAEAMGATQPSFHIGLVAFGFLIIPINFIVGIFLNIYSRKNEYEADSFACKHKLGKYLKSALIKLSQKNLSNLTPHPLYEFVYYSHPSLLKRLKKIT